MRVLRCVFVFGLLQLIRSAKANEELVFTDCSCGLRDTVNATLSVALDTMVIRAAAGAHRYSRLCFLPIGKLVLITNWMLAF